jgi:hypothetical protein
MTLNVQRTSFPALLRHIKRSRFEVQFFNTYSKQRGDNYVGVSRQTA